MREGRNQSIVTGCFWFEHSVYVNVIDQGEEVWKEDCEVGTPFGSFKCPLDVHCGWQEAIAYLTYML